jgi:hypothetical protein
MMDFSKVVLIHSVRSPRAKLPPTWLRAPKEARSRGMVKKAYSCGISKIDRFPKAINKVNICLLLDKYYSN